MLESRRGSGTYVAEADLDGVYDVRLRLEPFAAERAARFRTDVELAEMERTVATMRRQVDDSEPFNVADARFHSIVAAASRSTVLRSTLDRLSELALLTRTVVSPSDRSRQNALTDVERVLLAIERQHPKRAANAMERHLLNVRDDYQRMIGNGAKPIDSARRLADS